MPAKVINKFQHWWDTKIEPEPNSGCWLWSGGINRLGYGVAAIDRRPGIASRIIYELLRGPVADDKQLDHLCRVKSCVNPAHLEVVTQQENLRRALPFRKPVTHCPQGHEYTPENTRTRNRARHCRECGRAARRAWYDRTSRKPKVKATHCKRGHELSGDNIRLRDRGSYVERVCRLCQRERFEARA